MLSYEFDCRQDLTLTTLRVLRNDKMTFCFLTFLAETELLPNLGLCPVLVCHKVQMAASQPFGAFTVPYSMSIFLKSRMLCCEATQKDKKLDSFLVAPQPSNDISCLSVDIPIWPTRLFRLEMLTSSVQTAQIQKACIR
jgi:hypothetical protein